MLSIKEELRKFQEKNKKSRVNFIQDLLNSPLLDVGHKEKLIKFAAAEIKKLEGDHDAVKNDVEIIKKKLGEISEAIGGKEKNDETTQEDEQTNSKTVHNPQKLVNLLSNFRKNGSALKYSVHRWDKGLKSNDYETFVKQLKSEYSKISWELKKLSENLQAKCFGFLINEQIGKKGWGYDRIKVGWGSPELASWCKEKPHRNPLEYPFRLSIPDREINFYSFENVVDHFKKEIEIREEKSQLEKLIKDQLKIASLLNPLSEFGPPKMINLKSKNFYTDVQWFRSSIATIFNEIKKRRDEQCKDISIEAIEDNQSIELKITHYNSYSEGYSIEVENKLTKIGGDFESIKNNLENLCDWSIVSKFREGFYRLNYLCSDTETPFIQKVDNCEGFTHFLKFYNSNV